MSGNIIDLLFLLSSHLVNLSQSYDGCGTKCGDRVVVLGKSVSYAPLLGFLRGTRTLRILGTHAVSAKASPRLSAFVEVVRPTP